MTQIANIESLDYYHKTEPQQEKNYLTEIWCPLAESIIFWDLLVRGAATRLGTTPYDLMTEVYKGYHTGYPRALRFLNQAFGPIALTTLAVLDPVADHSHPYILKGIAERDFHLDGTDILYKSCNYQYGQKIKVFGDFEIQALSAYRHTPSGNGTVAVYRR